MTEPASIRYKNPGAMWGGNPWSKKWGELGNVALADGTGQDNHIAVFPSYVAGICAQIDLWRGSSHYKNKPFAEGIATWSGHNSVESYVALVTKRVPGMTRNTIMNDEFWRGPMAIPFLKAQAFHEAGREYPAPDSDWIEAQRRVLSGAMGAPLPPPPDVPRPLPKPPTPIAPKVGAVGVVGAALLAVWKFIVDYPVPTLCGVAIAVALTVYLLKRK